MLDKVTALGLEAMGDRHGRLPKQPPFPLDELVNDALKQKPG